MSFPAHLNELAEKHKILERKIDEAMARPGTNDAEIRRMRQGKLKLKDKIHRLKQVTRH